MSKSLFIGRWRPFHSGHKALINVVLNKTTEALPPWSIGWTHFDFALRKYKERAELMMERENDLFYFSTYFTWFIRQGIIEYLIREKIIPGH